MERVCMCVCVCVCGTEKLEVCTMLACPHVSSFHTTPEHACTRACFLIPFEDCELTGLKVDMGF